MDEKNLEIQKPNSSPPTNEGSEQRNPAAQDSTPERERSLISKPDRRKDRAADPTADNENQAKKLSFPKGIFFIISNEFCERFNYYGTREILLTYFMETLQYSFETAVLILHVLKLFGILFSFVGAIMSDSWLGKFRTILFISVANIFGSVLTALGAIPYFEKAAGLHTFVGMTLITLSSGFISPCVAAFGGDQHKLPEQSNQLAWFFLLFYFNFHSGLLISTSITPIIRDEVHCFGENKCRSLAFAVPALLMIVGLGEEFFPSITHTLDGFYPSFLEVIFLVGRPFYNIIEPSGNIFKLTIQTIYSAITTKYRARRTNPRGNWLDYADKKYDRHLISDIKSFGRIFILFLPLPFVWGFLLTMYENWIYQANRMDGDMGSYRLHVKYLKIFQILLALLFLPLCQLFIYPALKFIRIHTQLQKMVFGGILASVAFIISSILELFVAETNPHLPENGKTQLRIFNGEPCDYVFKTNLPGRESFEIGAFDYFEDTDIPVKNGTFQFDYQIRVKSEAPECRRFTPDTHSMRENRAHRMFMASNGPDLKLIWYKDRVFKPEGVDLLVRTLTNVESEGRVIWKTAQKGNIAHEEEVYANTLTNFSYGPYKIFIDEVEVYEVYLKIGGIYTVVIYEAFESGYIVRVFELKKPNSVPLPWIVPQFVLLTLAEVIFSVTALEFSYSQAPVSMKSIVMACLIWTKQLGTVIVAMLDLGNILNSKAMEFFLIACLMIADMLVFMVLALLYKPNNPKESGTQRQGNV